MEQFQNWLRIVVCLDIFGLPALKNILHDEIGAPEDGKKLYIYLHRFRLVFKQEKISEDQKQKLFPLSNITDEDKFDISLYSLIINTIIKYDKSKIQTNRKFIYGLKNFRNRIYHMGDKKMEEVDFEREWNLVIRFFHGYNKCNSKSVTSLKTDSLTSPKFIERIIFIFSQESLHKTDLKEILKKLEDKMTGLSTVIVEQIRPMMQDYMQKITERNSVDNQNVASEISYIDTNESGNSGDSAIKNEEVEHCKYCYDLGYDVISHISNEDLICDSIPNFHGSKGKSFSMPLKHGQLLFRHIGDFREYCKQYFIWFFQEIMKQDVFSLPYVDKNGFDRNSILKEPFCTIMVTMKDWCNNNQTEENIKGLVIYGYSLDSHLKHCKYPESIRRDDYYNTLFEEKDETVIVYNPAEKVILFIKIAKTQNLEYEMKLSTSDLIKFMLIYNAVLEKSGIKLINLLVTEKELDYKWKCEKCKFQVITLQFLRSQELFEKWWKEREIYFGKEFSHRDISNSFSLDFCATILGFLAGLQYIEGSNFQGMLPSLTNIKHEQMEEAQLLSLERLKIVHSSPSDVKHLKVKGCYGSVMSTVALEMMGFKLKKDEIMYYVMEHPRSQSVQEMGFISNEENKKVIYHNNTVKLSKILDKLIMDNESKKKIHIIAVECDGEQLDKAEVLKLNGMLTTNDKFKDSTAFLFFQSVEKKRMEDDKEKESNMFAGLKMREEILVYNMRNSVEINDLVAYTVDGLTKQPSDQNTTFFLTDSDTADQSIEQSNQTETSNETRTANDSKDQVKKKKKKKKNRGKTDGQAQSVMKPRTTNGMNDHSYPEASDAIIKLTLDETFEYSVPSKTRASKKIVSTFKHMKSIQCGHNITCEIPSLFEINYPESSSEFKILLIFILQRIVTESFQYRRVYDIERLEDLLNIPKNIKKYVILHFDSRNYIPEILDTAFNLMKIRHLVTSDYEEFKGGKDWIFLVCSYRAFRGRDYSRVILVLHPSMYYLKHFIPECLSRCNTYLRIIVLNSVNQVVNRNPNEISRTIIDTWKSPKDGILRVNVWDIELCDITKQKDSEKSQPEDQDTRKKIKIQIRSNLYTDLEKKLEKLTTVPGKNK